MKQSGLRGEVWDNPDGYMSQTPTLNKELNECQSLVPHTLTSPYEPFFEGELERVNRVPRKACFGTRISYPNHRQIKRNPTIPLVTQGDLILDLVSDKLIPMIYDNSLAFGNVSVDPRTKRLKRPTDIYKIGRKIAGELQ